MVQVLQPQCNSIHNKICIACIMIEIARGIINARNAKDTATTSFVPFLQKHFDICYGVEYLISYQVLMTTHSC